MRSASVERKTTEVDIRVELNIDGEGKSRVATGIKFLNHLLTTLAKHALFDLTVSASGDLKHHVNEDIALALGEAMEKALADKRGIMRFGSTYVPMDESLARGVVDLGGRACCLLDLKLAGSQTEDLKTEDIEHFFSSFAQASKSNIHLAVIYGSNDHHKIEAATKALAIALRQATALESRIHGKIPSTKGVL